MKQEDIMLTILVVDDHKEEREGIAFLIKELGLPSAGDGRQWPQSTRLLEAAIRRHLVYRCKDAADGRSAANETGSGASPRAQGHSVQRLR